MMRVRGVESMGRAAHGTPGLQEARQPGLWRAQCLAVFLAFLLGLSATTYGQARASVESKPHAQARSQSQSQSLRARALSQSPSQSQSLSWPWAHLQSQSQSQAQPQAQSRSQSRSPSRSQSQSQALSAPRAQHWEKRPSAPWAGPQAHPELSRALQHAAQRGAAPQGTHLAWQGAESEAEAGARRASDGPLRRDHRERQSMRAGRGARHAMGQKGEGWGRRESGPRGARGERGRRRRRRAGGGGGRREARELVQSTDVEMVGRVQEFEDEIQKSEIQKSEGGYASNATTTTTTPNPTTRNPTTTNPTTTATLASSASVSRTAVGSVEGGSHTDKNSDGVRQSSESSSHNSGDSGSHSDNDSHSISHDVSESSSWVHSDDKNARIDTPGQETAQHSEQDTTQHSEQDSVQHSQQDKTQHSEQDPAQHLQQDSAQHSKKSSEKRGAAEAEAEAEAEAGGGKQEPTPAGFLGETIHLSNLVRLALNPLDHFFSQPDRVRFTCNQPLFCPQFQSCPAALSSQSRRSPSSKGPFSLPDPLAPPGSISFCGAGFADAPTKRFPLPPASCRKWHDLGDEGRRSLHGGLPPYLLRELHPGTPEGYRDSWLDNQVLLREPGLGCAHQGDFIPLDPVAFGVYRLEGVFVSREALVFNRTSLFLRNGCQEGNHHDLPMTLEAGQVRVVAVPEAINWAYRQGSNFYHSLIESFPLFLSLAPILSAHPHIPLLGIFYQFELYASLLEPLVGVPLAHIRRYEFGWNDRRLFKVDTLYQPVYQFCGHLSVSQWTELRRRHLLHPEGIPMFNPDWSLRGPTQPLSDEAMRRIPDDWAVVLLRRTGPTRGLVGFRELRAGLVALFSAPRVKVFQGSRGILEARALFMRTRLLVGSHGAALSNMVFMPAGADVIEIRPEEYKNACYHSLADACSLQYSLVMGKGRKSSNVTVDVQLVLAVVKHIAQRQGFLHSA